MKIIIEIRFEDFSQKPIQKSDNYAVIKAIKKLFKKNNKIYFSKLSERCVSFFKLSQQEKITLLNKIKNELNFEIHSNHISMINDATQTIPK